MTKPTVFQRHRFLVCRDTHAISVRFLSGRRCAIREQSALRCLRTACPMIWSLICTLINSVVYGLSSATTVLFRIDDTGADVRICSFHDRRRLSSTCADDYRRPLRQNLTRHGRGVDRIIARHDRVKHFTIATVWRRFR